MSICFLFPGQGTQRTGMLRDLGELTSSMKEVFDLGTEITGVDLRNLCLSANNEELKKTINTQLAVTAMNMAYYRKIMEYDIKPTLVAGHSLGELSAIAASGSIDLYTLFEIVKKRAMLMENVKQKGVLTSIKGLDFTTVEKICKYIDCSNSRVKIALYNTLDQIVIGGFEQEVMLAAENCLKAGAINAVALNVSAAFHTPIMKEMLEEYSEFIEGIRFESPKIPLLLNCSGSWATGIEDIKTDLKKQCCECVDWVGSMEQANLLSDIFVEVGMGKTLTGMIRSMKFDKVCIPVSDSRKINQLRR